jgi:hypothetical protein
MKLSAVLAVVCALAACSRHRAAALETFGDIPQFD